jgi:hypothetical protein
MCNIVEESFQYTEWAMPFAEHDYKERHGVVCKPIYYDTKEQSELAKQNSHENVAV